LSTKTEPDTRGPVPAIHVGPLRDVQSNVSAQRTQTSALNSCCLTARRLDVDGRHKAGHDGEMKSLP